MRARFSSSSLSIHIYMSKRASGIVEPLHYRNVAIGAYKSSEAVLVLCISPSFSLPSRTSHEAIYQAALY